MLVASMDALSYLYGPLSACLIYMVPFWSVEPNNVEKSHEEDLFS